MLPSSIKYQDAVEQEPLIDEEDSGPWKSGKGVCHFADLCVVDEASKEKQKA